MLTSHLICCCPFLFLPLVFPSIRVCSKVLALLNRQPKCWNFNFSLSPYNEYSRLISFRIHWFDFLGVQGTIKSLFQHHSSKASMLLCSAFFTVQFSHQSMTTRKTRALTIWTYVSKVTSLLFNMLSRFVKAFLPRSKHLLISWLQRSLTVILEPKKKKNLSPLSLFPLLFAME